MFHYEHELIKLFFINYTKKEIYHKPIFMLD